MDNENVNKFAIETLEKFLENYIFNNPNYGDEQLKSNLKIQNAYNDFKKSANEIDSEYRNEAFKYLCSCVLADLKNNG